MAATLTIWKYYIIEPELAINLCTNPSAETAIAGYFAGTNCTVTQSSEQARRGKYSVKGVPTGADTAAYIYTTITPTAVAHAFSVDVYGVAGVHYTAQIQLAADGTVRGTTAFIGNGHWQRITVTGTMTAAPHNLIVERVASQGTVAAFYADGWLFKTGADNNYFDGDSIDRYMDTPQFYWNGTPHASTSTRLASTRAGGTLLDISDYAIVTGIHGLGLTSFDTNTSGLALGGELYQNSHANARQFSLICVAEIDSTAAYGTLQRKLARLQKAVNPKRMKTDQPLRLMIVGYDDAGTEASDRVIIECIYQDGLPGSLTGRKIPFVLTFRQCDPTIKADGMIVTSLAATGAEVTTTTAAGACSILIVDESTGAGSSLSNFSGAELDVIFDNVGGEYIFGSFANYGDANGDGIVYRNSAGTISSLGSGAVATLNAAIIGLDGKLYVGGTGANIGGVAAADYIASWNGTAWAALQGGFNNAVHTLCLDNLGNLYAGGTFTQATTGPVTVNYVAKWNGSAWSAIGGATKGVSGGAIPVISILSLPDNKIVLCGAFTSAGGDAAIKYLAIYNPVTDAFSSIGEIPNAAVYKLLYDSTSGILYAFGSFTEIGGVAASYAAYWDGSNWNQMPGVNGTLYYAKLGHGNIVYAMGEFTIGGMAYTLSIAKWTGSLWQLVEYKGGPTQFWWNYKRLTNQVYMTAYTAGITNPSFTIPAVSAITNSTEGDIYPILTLDATGYYIHSLWNRTTGDRIYLNGLKVGLGEKIELVFSPTGYTITSNLRGDMRSSVLSGSTPNFRLRPGVNYVSCFVYPSPTAAVTIPLKYTPGGYLSLDETVFE